MGHESSVDIDYSFCKGCFKSNYLEGADISGYWSSETSRTQDFSYYIPHCVGQSRLQPSFRLVLHLFPSHRPGPQPFPTFVPSLPPYPLPIPPLHLLNSTHPSRPRHTSPSETPLPMKNPFLSLVSCPGLLNCTCEYISIIAASCHACQEPAQCFPCKVPN